MRLPMNRTFSRAGSYPRHSSDCPGLKASGSCDYSIEDIFVPEEMTFRFTDMASGAAVAGGAALKVGVPWGYPPS